MSIFIKGSLVYYKSQPAIITNVDKKIDITLENGTAKKVRDKDLLFIHSGPIKSFNELNILECDLEETWAMLEGELFSLEDLAEFLYGKIDTNSVYNSFIVVNNNLYFSNTDDNQVTCNSRGYIDGILSKEKAKEEKERLFNSAISRLKKGKWEEEDRLLIKEIEEVALDQRGQSKILKSLGIKENPVSAHKFLLKVGFWDLYFDPVPGRNHLSLQSTKKVSNFKSVNNPLDLTHLNTYAIDDEGSKDPDDAISLESDNRVWVHITDVASIITPGSPEDLDASSKGSNLYLPFKTVHMLPKELTEIQGLGIKEENNTLSFLFEFNDNLEIINREIHLARVKVKRKTYTQVENEKENPEYKRLYEISKALFNRRQLNGAISITLPEVKIRVDEDNNIEIKEIGYISSRDVVGEFMMVAGESAAIFARDNSIPIPYATQLPPDAKGTPEDNLSSMYVWRRKFKRGETKFAPEPHAGLGLDLYTRATSPLRRYSDLVVNQQIRAFLKNEELQNEEDLILKVMPGIESSKKLAACERESNLFWKLVYIKNNLDKTYKGVYVEKKDKGKGVVLIEELALDSLVPISDELEINSLVSLKVKSVDVPQGEVSFTIC